MNAKKWDDLTDRQKAALLVAASVELALTATALVDLARRPRELVRGPKAIWLLGCLVQPVGPIAYLTIGARRS
jgi:Phospholipase_D-nuclease N-terminal